MSASGPPPHALEVTPESSLQFSLNRTPADASASASASAAAAGSTPPTEPTSRCTMTLRHTGRTSRHLAFKVKTTQPRRYLVRPNQGIVSPNSTETVSILLVERDKQILLHSYDRLGQSALDHSKDKFLVQSCEVDDAFASKFVLERQRSQKLMDEGGAEGSKVSGMSKEMADSLTSMWNAASSGGEVPIHNKKLHVRHVVPPGDAGGAADAAAAPAVAAPAPGTNSRSLPRNLPPSTSSPAPSSLQPTKATGGGASPENMTPEQMVAELAGLRRKYDELVSFSVNLTAERDILNNTLEQTKRDLNRETAARASLEGGAAVGGGKARAGEATGGGVPMAVVVLALVVFLLIGVRLGHSGVAASLLGGVPLLSSALGLEEGGGYSDEF